MLRDFSITVSITVVLSGCLRSIAAVGEAGYLEQCYPDFEEEYHVKEDPEFAAYKFLCSTEKNLECNILAKNKTGTKGDGEFEDQNIQVVDASSSEDEQVWTCGCKANTTYIQFKAIKETYDQAQLLKLNIGPYDILNQSSSILFTSRCVTKLEEPCRSNGTCPPNSLCLPNHKGHSVCQCPRGYFPIQQACYKLQRHNYNYRSKVVQMDRYYSVSSENWMITYDFDSPIFHNAGLHAQPSAIFLMTIRFYFVQRFV